MHARFKRKWAAIQKLISKCSLITFEIINTKWNLNMFKLLAMGFFANIIVTFAFAYCLRNDMEPMANPLSIVFMPIISSLIFYPFFCLLFRFLKNILFQWYYLIWCLVIILSAILYYTDNMNVEIWCKFFVPLFIILWVNGIYRAKVHERTWWWLCRINSCHSF